LWIESLALSCRDESAPFPKAAACLVVLRAVENDAVSPDCRYCVLEQACADISIPVIIVNVDGLDLAFCGMKDCEANYRGHTL
jgi:hypothetical protein